MFDRRHHGRGNRGESREVEKEAKTLLADEIERERQQRRDAAASAMAQREVIFLHFLHATLWLFHIFTTLPSELVLTFCFTNPTWPISTIDVYTLFTHFIIATVKLSAFALAALGTFAEWRLRCASLSHTVRSLRWTGREARGYFPYN